MTTTVTVQAHCDYKTTEVLVEVTEEGSVEETYALQDKEAYDSYVYDNREIIVKEVSKEGDGA